MAGWKKFSSIKFNPYFGLDSLPLCKKDSCFSIMKHLFPYFKRQSSVGSFDSMLESIIAYVKKSRMPQNKLDSELDYVVNALYTPFESPDTVIMFIDSKGKLMAVNNAFQKAYKYPKNKVANEYVGNYTQTVWFDKFLNKPDNFEAPKYFPGNHTNIIKCSDRTKATISGNTWPLIDSCGKFYGAVSVHRKLCC